MLSYKDFLFENIDLEPEKESEPFYPGGVYISVKLSEESELNINEYCNKYLKKVKVNESLHSTLVYSQKEHKEEIVPEDYKYIATFDGFDLFGENEDILVFKLRCAPLIRRNNKLVQEHGFVSDFEEYRPHITLAYEAEGVDLNSLPEIDFAIELQNETIEQLDTDWLGKDKDNKELSTISNMLKKAKEKKSKEKDTKDSKEKEDDE